MVDTRHIGGGIAVLLIVGLFATVGLAQDNVATQPDEFTVNCPGNWTEWNDSNDTQICSDITGLDNVTSTEMKIDAWGVDIGEGVGVPQIQYREVVVMNNTLDYEVTVNWDDSYHDDANITIPANGQEEIIVRGYIYGSVHADTEEGGFPLQFSMDTVNNGVAQTLYNLVM